MDNKKHYVGSLYDLTLAAIIADLVIIQLKAIESTVNFAYKRCDLLAILFQESVMDTSKILNESENIIQ